MKLSLAALALIAASGAAAQHSPYAGQHVRELKALSPEQIRQYESGAGMGYARAAELNQYPGPMHVLELAEALRLETRQSEAIRALMAEHRREAAAIGKALVAAERELDAMFAATEITAENLAAGVARIAEIDGRYRLSHLETHRRTRALLTGHQVKLYDELRGYGQRGAAGSHSGKHH